MNNMGNIKRLTPKWAAELARDIFCSFRSSVICGPIAYQKVTNKPALIVAPHPDDETFACGGLIKLKRAAGVPVRVVVLTDGEGVASGLGEKPETVIAARQREALDACQRLGVDADSVRWLHLSDTNLAHPGQPGFDEAVQALLAEIQLFAPGEIYCPHLQDIHPDHIAATYLTHQAVRLWCWPCAIFYYPVWMWYHSQFGLRKRLKTTGAWRLDISAVRTEKDQAIAAYLDAPTTARGDHFSGDLPRPFLRNFRRKFEVFFPAATDGDLTACLPCKAGMPATRLAGTAKALFVNPGDVGYGSGQSMVNLLRAKQFDAEVVCPGGGDLERELEELGVKFLPLEFNKYSLWQNPRWQLNFYRRFRSILKASKPDVVVINLDGNTPLVTLAAVRAGIPIIRFSRFEFKPPDRWVDRWAWLKATTIICPSELVKQQVLAWVPPELHSRVLRLYDPHAGRVATAQGAASFRREFGLGDVKLIGCIGRLHRGKRIETAIEALAEVRKHVANVRLLIIGGGDEAAYKAELQHLAADLGMREAVTFTGYRRAEDMPAAIASLDICVLPSESESFGMVLMEAWAEGVPTVASNISACCEISQASGGGYLAPVGDAGAFARELQALLTNPESAAAMGQRGRAWVDQNCDLADYAAKFESVINACK